MNGNDTSRLKGFQLGEAGSVAGHPLSNVPERSCGRFKRLVMIFCASKDCEAHLVGDNIVYRYQLT
jgi:hypothetical protein